ncbi:unnamed protein product [Sphenostylis stenocarpa]|uniref:Uncharacterized protein n=1 Tax=Sphenostylis stenocarpa TaxID=92480 RepID=A0AA86V8M5_9FABA|nr:unnamed protein product [Sphenostylis stenocarpa]
MPTLHHALLRSIKPLKKLCPETIRLDTRSFLNLVVYGVQSCGMAYVSPYIISCTIGDGEGFPLPSFLDPSRLQCPRIHTKQQPILIARLHPKSMVNASSLCACF